MIKSTIMITYENIIIIKVSKGESMTFPISPIKKKKEKEKRAFGGKMLIHVLIGFFKV